MFFFFYMRSPSYPNNRLLGYVIAGHIEARTHYLGNRAPWVYVKGSYSSADLVLVA